MSELKGMFLPYYSERYFKKRKNKSEGKWVFALIAGSMIIPLATVVHEKPDQISAYLILACIIAATAYFLSFSKFITKRKEEKGFWLKEDGIVQTGMFKRNFISYAEYDEAVRNGQYFYETEGLRIGKGSRKLVFFYEIGNKSAQEDILACYEELQRHMVQPLPALPAKDLDLFDRKYFYEKNRRAYVLLLALAFFVFLIVTRTQTFNYGTLLLVGGGFCLWETYCYAGIFENAVFSARNYEALKKSFPNQMHAIKGRAIDGYVWFLVVFVVGMILNVWCILG